jgi:multidrug efflux pump subunit AcrB
MVLVCLLGVGAALRMPTDIFPEIDIPVVSVVWTYNGMSASEIQDRIVALHERQLASLVDDIQRIEANCYEGVGVIKVYLHEGADVTRAVSQLGSSALVVLKYMPRNITPPLVLRYGATDVPIIQLSVSSPSLSDTRLNDLGQNVIRPDLAVVQGASVPYPYGGKPRVIMVDLNLRALQARGLSPEDISNALQRENVILPSGDVKLGRKDYPVSMNNSPNVIDNLNRYPIKAVNGKWVFIRDVAHVHDGYQVQTNVVEQNGVPGSLITVRKTGGSSTLAVIDGVKEALPGIQQLMPAGVKIKPLFDQSIFVKASLNSVIMGGLMACGLTALMILLFLGNWRLTLIILASIPLSIVAAVLALYCLEQTLNTMTLGGFALAVGILVDNATVVIENVERHIAEGEELEPGIVNGSSEIVIATVLSTLSICIVFVPVFLLQGTAKYLFSPLSMSVCLALLASLALSFTLVPVLFKYLMRSYVQKHKHRRWQGKVRRRVHIPSPGSSGEGREGAGFGDLGSQNEESAPDDATPTPALPRSTARGSERGRGRRPSWWQNPLAAVHYYFEKAFHAFRSAYRSVLSWAVARPMLTCASFVVLMGLSCLLYPLLGMDFFPDVDAGQMRLHVRTPAGTRIEQTQDYFAQVEAQIRHIVGNDQIDVMLDNIGLPYSGINIALSDTATVGPMDGEILISLKKHHTPTAEDMARLRRELPPKFPDCQFFFQPADIINQVLNFGMPAPIDIRVSGPHLHHDYATANKLVDDLKRVPGLVDVHVFQVPDVPSLRIRVNRDMAMEAGISQENAADSVLVALNSSAQIAPNFWLDARNGVSYPLVVQTPTYQIRSMADLKTVPVTAANGGRSQLLMNVASFSRDAMPMVQSQLNIRPVFDVNANVQGRDLMSVARAIDKTIAADRPDPSQAINIRLAGQVATMRESFTGLFWGMGLAVVLIFLLLVVNFQSWLDPLIVLMAIPFALAGVMWMLFLTDTHISVPALMGSLMCIGLATANSILVVTFANQRMEAGDDALTAAVSAGYIRLRPVLMTAGAMILGMIPMALGLGEGGEQNAPLARAVIGGLLFATVATLIFVPTMYRLLRRRIFIPSPGTPGEG